MRTNVKGSSTSEKAPGRSTCRGLKMKSQALIDAFASFFESADVEFFAENRNIELKIAGIV